MEVEEILESWLKENGYDGLLNAGAMCGCQIGDLIPCCGDGLRDCEPGYKVPCDGNPDGEGDCDGDCEFHIVSERPEISMTEGSASV